MNNLQISNHPEFGNVRWIEVKEKLYAVAIDIAKPLGYVDPHVAIRNHCKGVVKLTTPTNGGYQEVKVIPEGDIYRLIIKAADQSKNEDIKAKAEIFEKWIFDEVIPAIRKTGSYSVKKQPDLKKLLAAVKTKREFFLLSGLSKRSAYSKALESVEKEYKADLSEFRPSEIAASNSADIPLILEAIDAAIANGAVYRNFGNESYALNRDMVYAELDARELNRVKSLRALNQAEILNRGGRHFTRKIKVNKNTVRAVFVRLNHPICENYTQ